MSVMWTSPCKLWVDHLSFHSEIELWQGVACQTLMRSVLTNDLGGVWYIQDTKHVGNVSSISKKNDVVHYIPYLQVGLTECSMINFWWPLCNNCPHNLLRVRGRGDVWGWSGGMSYRCPSDDGIIKMCRARKYGPEWGESCDAWLSHLNERPPDTGTLSQSDN